MGAREPADPPGQLVRRLLQVARGPLPGRLRRGRIGGAGEAEAAEVLVRLRRHQVAEPVARLHVEHVLPLPDRRAGPVEVGRDLELHQGAFPQVRLDRPARTATAGGRPRSRVRAAGCSSCPGSPACRRAGTVRSRPRRRPRSRAPRMRTSSERRSPEPVEPGDQQIAVRQLDDRRTVVVPVLEGEDQLPRGAFALPLGPRTAPRRGPQPPRRRRPTGNRQSRATDARPARPVDSAATGVIRPARTPAGRRSLYSAARETRMISSSLRATMWRFA